MINRRYVTPPMEKTSLIAALVTFGAIFLTVAALLSPNIFVWLLAVGIYSVVVVVAIVINAYLRKVWKDR